MIERQAKGIPASGRFRPEFSPNPEPDVPVLERKYVLTYLVAKFRRLPRQDVVSLAEQLYSDTTNGVPRPLKDICKAAGLLNGQAKPPDRDSFFNRVALSYTTTEMEQIYSLTPHTEDDIPPRYVDLLAGDGPPRPLLKELYSLESLGEVVALTSTDDNQEVFVPTNAGAAHAEALQVIFRYLNLPANTLVVVGRDSTTLHRAGAAAG